MEVISSRKELYLTNDSPSTTEEELMSETAAAVDGKAADSWD